jgi:hypothetical protein
VTGKDIARLKRRLKRASLRTRRERAEYVRVLLETEAEEDEQDVEKADANLADRES